MPPIELECPVVGCDIGEGGGRYNTSVLPLEEALQLLISTITIINKPRGLLW